jgi:hypothetical protein
MFVATNICFVPSSHARGHDATTLSKSSTFVAIAHVSVASKKLFVVIDECLLSRIFSWLRVGMPVATMK